MIQPKEIIKDCETGKELASFNYYTGKEYIKQNNLTFCCDFNTVGQGGYYLVCCGDIMTLVTPDMFPNIERKVLQSWRM